MQQVAAAAWSPASDRKIYVVWIGVVWAAILTGFCLDFVRYLGETPPPPFILHVHAAVFVLWLGLVTLQILWVEMGNLRRHKQLGWLTVAVSVLVVPLGLDRGPGGSSAADCASGLRAAVSGARIRGDDHLLHFYDRRRHVSQESGRAQTTNDPLGGCHF